MELNDTMKKELGEDDPKIDTDQDSDNNLAKTKYLVNELLTRVQSFNAQTNGLEKTDEKRLPSKPAKLNILDSI